jgi:hypothetical protein
MTKPSQLRGFAQEFEGAFLNASDEAFYDSIPAEDRVLLEGLADELDEKKTSRSRRKIIEVIKVSYARGMTFGNELGKAGEGELARFQNEFAQNLGAKREKFMQRRILKRSR